MLEIGSSAGSALALGPLPLRHRATATRAIRRSAVRLRSRVVGEPEPPLVADVEVARRRGSDIAPIDVTTRRRAHRRCCRSCGPISSTRIERLRAALDDRRRVPVAIDQRRRRRLAAGCSSRTGRATGAATVVFHSIVWQYLPRADEGRRRAQRSPPRASRRRADGRCCWLRMEPSNAEHAASASRRGRRRAHEELLAEVGYHGADVALAAPADATAPRTDEPPRQLGADADADPRRDRRTLPAASRRRRRRARRVVRWRAQVDAVDAPGRSPNAWHSLPGPSAMLASRPRRRATITSIPREWLHGPDQHRLAVADDAR